MVNITMKEAVSAVKDLTFVSEVGHDTAVYRTEDDKMVEFMIPCEDCLKKLGFNNVAEAVASKEEIAGVSVLTHSGRKFHAPKSSTVEAMCPCCGHYDQIKVSRAAREEFRNGKDVQDAFPELTPGQREFFFLSHLCEKCFDEEFKEEDE